MTRPPPLSPTRTSASSHEDPRRTVRSRVGTGDELARRSDVVLEGTRRYGEIEYGVQFEVVVPSEVAGSDDWDIDKVEDALAAAIAAGELVEEGAANVVGTSSAGRGYRFGEREQKRSRSRPADGRRWQTSTGAKAEQGRHEQTAQTTVGRRAAIFTDAKKEEGSRLLDADRRSDALRRSRSREHQPR